MAGASDKERIVREGLAVKAVAIAEMGGTTEDIIMAMSPELIRFGLILPEEIREVAASISAIPQPLDESADERQRREPIEKALGLPSPIELLTATLRARDALEQLATSLEDTSPT